MLALLKTTMRRLRTFMFLFIAVFLLPLGLHAVWWLSREDGRGWSQVSWSSAGLLPAPAARPDAMIHIYAARVGRWRGIFAHHTWIVIKAKGAGAYTRYDVVGWGRPVRTDGWAADARWFGRVPDLVASIEGSAAEALIPKVRAAVANYPFAQMGGYRAWPGPNSNTFVNHVLAAIPEAGIALPPTALGKDFREGGVFAGYTPSRSGVQVALGGLAGISIGWIEGVELNVLGLVAGVDVRRPAIKLPGWGRIGVPSAPVIGTAEAKGAS